MQTSLTWVGDGASRMEVAHVELGESDFTAVGTQLGLAYELRYRLEPSRLFLEVVGESSREVELADADFFDLGWSPLFNSLPVIHDELLESDPPRSYEMRWVDVPSLAISKSEQRYEPLGKRQVRFSAGDFTTDIRFDAAGFVLEYPRNRCTRTRTTHLARGCPPSDDGRTTVASVISAPRGRKPRARPTIAFAPSPPPSSRLQRRPRVGGS